jgi:TetR/AcrR family transcriptional regulator
MVSQQSVSPSETVSTRESILDSATEVFMEAGFSGARVDEIARRARANKAMIYYHFGSKQHLYRAVLLGLFGEVLEEIARLKTSDASPKSRLRSLYIRVAAHFEAKRALPHIMLREILAGGKGIDAEASRALFMILSFVAETIHEGVRTGEFREVDPLLLHVSILAPLMVHHVGDSFRERILPREMPGVDAPTHDDMLQHLLISLERSLSPSSAALPASTVPILRNTR